MVTNWLCITNNENWEVIKKRRTWGVPSRGVSKIKQVKPNDIAIIYVKPKKIYGVFKVVSEVFIDEKEIFNNSGFDSTEKFSHRISLKPLKILREPIDFGKLVPQLNFIQKKHKWGGYLMGKAMRTIPDEDYNLIKRTVGF